VTTATNSLERTPLAGPDRVRDDQPALVVARPPGRPDLDEWEVLTRDCYDRKVVREVWGENVYRLRAEDLDHTGNVVDLGACFGAFALAALALGARRVACVEPDHRNMEQLYRTVCHAWPREERPYATIEAAVGGMPGTRVRVVGSGTTAWTTTDLATDEALQDAGVVTLRQVMELCGATDRRGEPACDVLKVDVEGAEYELVHGTDDDTLARCRLVAMEWHGAATTRRPIDRSQRWNTVGALVDRLARTHHVETFGHPDRGGMLHARRYAG